MSGRFVRSSKYRHVYGQPAKKELSYENVRVSKNAWDSNLIKVNPKYLSVNWDASGGGAFAVIPLEEKGKVPDQIPLFRGHTATVLDTDWNPFDDNVLASASDDGKIGIWRVPENFSLHTEPGSPIVDVNPVSKLSGHTRKVGHVLFHPTASNVLASASGDYTVKLWDVESGKPKTTLKHKDIVLSFSFNYVGSLIATTSRDKKIRIWDPRSETIVSEGPGHSGAKNSRVVWLGELDRVATTGFSKMSDRQIAIWDTTDIAKGPINDFFHLDSSSGINIPYYDAGTRILYLAGKGDGNIRYYEYDNDDLFPLSEYKSTEPQRGIAFMPKRGISVHDNEVVRVYKSVYDSLIEPIQFIVPRRAETFQSDIYPDCPSAEPAISATEWFGGKDAAPKLISLEAVYEGQIPVAVASEIPVSKPVVAKPEPVKTNPAPVKPVEPVKTEQVRVQPKAQDKDLENTLNNSKVDDLLTKASNTEDVKVSSAFANEENSWNDEPEVSSSIVETAVPVDFNAEEPKSVETVIVPVKIEDTKIEDTKSSAKGPSVVQQKLEALHSHFSDAKKVLESYENRFSEIIAVNAKELAARDQRIDALENELLKLKDLLLVKSNGVSKEEFAETKEDATAPVEDKEAGKAGSERESEAPVEESTKAVPEEGETRSETVAA
ncbi:hypothetical protein V1514DRAFT_290574 [Lipomyces japonicus]|uniref:uncharacterized protein n=1 Tax=Lipomyces japonicus TaxID=56871 RepID=UPI0034CE6A5D